MELIERPPEKSNFSASDFRHTFDQLPGRKFADCINTAYTAGVNTRDFGRRDTDRILLMLEFVDLPRARFVFLLPPSPSFPRYLAIIITFKRSGHLC